MYSIDNTKPKKLSLYLAKPDKTTIAKLKHVKNRSMSIKLNEVNELAFTVPYYIDIDNKPSKNPHIDKFKEKFLIRAELGDKIEWFLINGIQKISEESNDLQIRCFSLGYQLQYHDVIEYEATGQNCLMATNGILRGTGWKAGYINPKFNLMYRRFEMPRQTKLNAIYEIRDTFDSIVVFDTEEKTVNHYTEEELSHYKGFSIGYGKYIQNIEEDIDADEIVTRLYVYGSDGLTINSVNPTGQSYIDDFSYFLYPFEMDEDENIISHSDYMSDSLAKALVKYNKFISNKKDEFGNLLKNKTEIQEKITSENNKLVELEVELQIILDAIVVAKSDGQPTGQLTTDRNNKNREIDSQKSIINEFKRQVENIDNNIQSLRDELKMESHLSEEQMNELYNFIQMDEWTDENQFDVNDLYEAGLEQIEKVNSPPINITTSIVNFLEMVSEKHNWDRFGIGDIIRIDHKKLDIDVKTTLSEIHYDFDNRDIDVTISNTKEFNSIEDKIKRAFYTIDKVNTDYNKRKIDWAKTAYNFNLRNDRIEETPTDPTNATISHKENDDGSVNLVLKWDYPDYNETEKNEDNVDGFIIYLYSDDEDEPYQFTSKMSEETLVDVSHVTRAYTFPSVPSNLFYTVGIAAYRRVDEDINFDGILFSEIVRFSPQNTPRTFKTFNLTNTKVITDNSIEPSEPYQPNTIVNLIGKVNSSRYTVSPNEPKSPEENDVWYNTKNFHFYIYTNGSWNKNSDLLDSIEYIDKNIDEMFIYANERFQDVISEVDRIENEVVPKINSELDRLHNEVFPGIENELDRINEITVPRINDELDRINNEVVPHIDSELDRIENEVIPVINEELDRINDVVVPNINSEIDRIENEVIPEVDRVIRETYVPKQDTPPDPTMGSGLWWDTTQDPPRFKRYNPVTGQWENVAYTEDEIDQIIIDTRKNIENNVITSINISPEDIVIESNKLDIYGVVSFINSDDSSMTLIDGGRIITRSIEAAQINVDELFANEAVIGIVQAGIVQTSELSASQITTGTLDAKKISVLDLSASSITTGVLDALKVNVQNLSADSIISGTLDALKVTVKDLSASSITSGTLDALKVTVKDLSADSITSGTLDALKVTVKDLSADSLTGGTLDALKVNVKNLSADSLISGTIDALEINIQNINASNIKSGTLDAIDILGGKITQYSGNNLLELDNGIIQSYHDGDLAMVLGGYSLEFYNRRNDKLAEIIPLKNEGEVTTRGLGLVVEHDFINIGIRTGGLIRPVFRSSFVDNATTISGPYNNLNEGSSLRLFANRRAVSEDRFSNFDQPAMILDQGDDMNNVTVYFGGFGERNNATFQVRHRASDSTSNRRIEANSDGVVIQGELTHSSGDAYYRNNRGGSDLTGEYALRAGGVRTRTGNSNFYVGVTSDGEFKVVSTTGTGGSTDVIYREARARNWNTSSSIQYKSHFEKVDVSGLDIINKLHFVNYRLNDDLEHGKYDLKQIGLISELSPEVATKDLKAIDTYKLSSYLGLAVQELDRVSKQQNNDIQTIYEVLKVLIDEIDKIKK